MLFLTKYFGVTCNDSERILGAEQALHDEIVEKVLLLQATAAAKAHCPLRRGTHAKGVSVRAQFEVLDVTVGRTGLLADRLAQGMFARPGVYPPIVRFANSDPNSNSDFKADVRALSFSVDLSRNATGSPVKIDRQDFSLQSASILPINDAPAFLATMKVLTARNPGAGLVVCVLQGQVKSSENSHTNPIAVAPDNQTLSAASLLEHCAVPSRPHRCCEAVRHAVAAQSCKPLAKK
jgi:hypothetical protein